MKRKPTFAPYIGSVSNGTMRDEDLIPTFASELRGLMKLCRVKRGNRKRFAALLRDADRMDFDGSDIDEPSDVTERMFDALNHFAPPYCTFGASEGDGADYGFWPLDRISLHEQLPRIPNDDDIPAEYWGEDVLVVNDHGNVECGRVDKRGRFHAYWSCV